MHSSESVIEFQNRYTKAMMWCREKFSDVDYINSLRTPELQPPNFNERLTFLRYKWDEIPQRVAAVDFVNKQRERLLNRPIHTLNHLIESEPQGMLLAYDPKATRSDAAMQNETDGYFDVDDVPPWDTWIYYTNHQKESSHWHSSFLICWVHPEIVSLVDEGIKISSNQSLRWLAELDTPFTKQLVEAKLLIMQ